LAHHSLQIWWNWNYGVEINSLECKENGDMMADFESKVEILSRLRTGKENGQEHGQMLGQ